MIDRVVIIVLLSSAFLGYSIFKILGGEWLAALVILLTGLLFVWAMLAGLSAVIETQEVFLPILGLITLFSILNTFMISPAMNRARVDKNIELLSQAVTVQYCPESTQPDASKRAYFRELNSILVDMCARQNHKNISDLAEGIAKARYLDPVSGLADQVYSDFMKGELPTCLSIAKRMDKICPGVFNL
ncbi:MAG: hypothetical protein RH947_08275 [Alcanivorax sp.]|jgi:ABC-type multidrug transport system permease subunit